MNVAALREVTYVAGKNEEQFYINTHQHSEMGHITIISDPSDIKDCDCAPAWKIIANYIGEGGYQMMLAYAPDRINIGGGVMNQTHLLSNIK